MFVDLVKLKQNPREIVEQYLDRFKEAREKYWSSIPIKKLVTTAQWGLK